jgi:hypothetical protein
MGYRWKIGNGRKVRFWEDLWFSTCSLAIQYWEIYSIINEQGSSVRDAWDGNDLKFTFRRIVNSRIMSLWLEVVQIASELHFSEEEEDAIIWQFASSEKYSVQTLYEVVNDRGVKQVYTPVMWKISVPSRLHIFLWLLANNKLLTRDNLAKRRDLDDASCLFCTDIESVHHLFFDCYVAKNMWQQFSEISGKVIGADFESVASMWLCAKRFKTINICTTAVLWTLWKVRNAMCFQEYQWLGMQGVFFKCAKLMRRWRLIQSEEVAAQLERVAKEWERRGTNLPRLLWTQPAAPRAVLSTPDDRDGSPSASVGCESDVTEPSAVCSLPEPVVGMMPVPQPVLEPCECAGHVLLETVSYE